MERQKDAVPGLEALLKESRADDPEVRWEAVQALGDFESLEALHAVADALQDVHPFVRWEAARSLGRFGVRLQQRGTRAALAGLLRSPSRVTTVLELLESQAGSENAAHRIAVADALGELRLTAGIAALLKLLKDENPEVRSSAVVALGKLGEEQAVPPLMDALRDIDLSVRCAAADALGRIGGPEAITTLLLWFHDETRMFRSRVVAALGHAGVGVRAVNRALIEALDDERPDVRWQAIRALGRGGNPTAIPYLEQYLADRTVVFGVSMGDLAREAVLSINRRHRGLWNSFRRFSSSVWRAIRVEKRR